MSKRMILKIYGRVDASKHTQPATRPMRKPHAALLDTSVKDCECIDGRVSKNGSNTVGHMLP